MAANRSRTRPHLANASTLPSRARIETGTGFELILSILHLAEAEARSRFVEHPLWVERRRAARAARTLAPLERLGAHPVFNLLGLAWEAPAPHGTAELLGYMASLPPLEITVTALGAYRRVYRRLTPTDVARAAAEGDAGARREFLRTAWPDVPEWQSSARYLLSRGGGEMGALLLDALRTWHERAFAGEEERIGAIQERARDALLTERATWSVDALATRVLPGMDYLPPAGVDEVVFVPDTVIRPAFVFDDHRMDAIAAFPVSLGEGESEEPPERLVRLGKALGDPLRLRALRLLSRGPTSMNDLAADLGVPRTTLSHHVGVLRAAGLVTLGIDDGRWGKLRLSPQGIDAAPEIFRRYVTEER